MARTWRLVGADGVAYDSDVPGALGGHRRTKVYGRLDCPGALRWIAKGYYVTHRVFFLDEPTAVAAGFRPCARCLPVEYRAWKAGRWAVPCVRPSRAPAAGRGARSARSASGG